jgi:DNA repair protein RecO (recombination protein O)
MLKRTSGIVLKSSVFGEADLIVTYLTSDYGVLKVFAKSPRKMKSRFGSSLEPLTYSRISFFGKEETALPRLTQADIIRPFNSLREDFRTLVAICEMLELNICFLPERDPCPELFDLLLTTLTKLETNSGRRLYYLFYKIKFLEMTGYSPKLDVCGRCGSGVHHGNDRGRTEPGASGVSAQGWYDFYILHGSIICPGCRSAGDESLQLSRSALKFYRSIQQWNSALIDRIQAPESLVSEIGGVIDSHISYALGPSRIARGKYLKGASQYGISGQTV